MPVEMWEAGQFRHPKLLIYGASGVGKTVLGGSAPRPIFADVEGGMRSIQHAGVARWPVNTWNDMRELVRFLVREEHQFQTLVIDSLNEVQRLLMDTTIEDFKPGQGGVPRRTYGNLPTLNDWGKMLADFERFIRGLKTVQMNVILLAATSGGLSSEGTIEPAFRGKETTQMVARYMDVVGYYAIREEAQGQGRTLTRALWFAHPNALTKDRSGRLPPSIEQPTWNALANFWPNVDRTEEVQTVENREEVSHGATH
jgi:hypothetical protein